jgi:hypothetical protein
MIVRTDMHSAGINSCKISSLFLDGCVFSPVDHLFRRKHLLCDVPCLQVDVFVHTYNLTVLSNNWSDERDQVLNVTEYQLLSPTEAAVTFQEEFLHRRSCDHSVLMNWGVMPSASPLAHASRRTCMILSQ